VAVYVDDITQHSAVLSWKNIHTGGVWDFKVQCAGVRQYVTAVGEREVDLDTVTQFVPQGLDRVFLSHLQPNFNYSCVVRSEPEDSSAGEYTHPLLFSTPYSAPELPESPVITYRNHGEQIDIQLFPSSTKYGPIE
jgi:hypothetical protein